MSTSRCYNCGKELSESEYGRRDSCPSCGRDTRACKNCAHYDKNYNNECREEQAARQVEKEKGNFCEWFQIKRSLGAQETTAKTDPKNAAEALFKKK